jgi:enoyl-CoA hydratase/carnithine racemase
VRITVEDRIGWLEFNRPEKRNAMNPALNAEMAEALQALDADDDCGVVVLTGAGDAWSAGMDLKEYFRALDDKPAERARANWNSQQFHHWKLANFPKPTIAMVNGWCFGGGFSPLISCDFAIAADDAKIGDFHIRRALFGGAGPIYRVPRMIGIRKTKELMLTGKLLSGIEAAEFGLINKSAPADKLDETVEDFIGDLTDKSPFTMWLTKMTIDRSLDADTQSLMVMEHLAVGVALNSEDAAEGVSAFLEKREPKWQGR